MFTSLYNKETLDTKTEVKQARAARQFVIDTGFPSVSQAIRMVTDGNIKNLDIIPKDIARSFEILGPIVESVKGKSTRRQVAAIPVDPYLDVMTVSMLSPLQLILISTLDNVRAPALGKGVYQLIATLHSRSFIATTINGDPHGLPLGEDLRLVAHPSRVALLPLV